jgi:NitT/TauT family transport system substrate-binding protein
MATAGGHVLVDEAGRWPGGQFPTAVLVVTTGFLARHAAAVRLLLRGQVRAEQFLGTDPSSAQAATNRALTAAGLRLPEAVLGQSFEQLRFSDDPHRDWLPVAIERYFFHRNADGLPSSESLAYLQL